MPERLRAVQMAWINALRNASTGGGDEIVSYTMRKDDVHRLDDALTRMAEEVKKAR